MPKVVWITGASQGLGAALAALYAQKNFNVVLTARNEDKLVQVKSRLVGDGHLVCPGDVTDEEAMRDILSKINATYQRLDVAILNAGTHNPLLPENYNHAVFQQLVDINIMGVVNSLLPTIDVMKTYQTGQIAVVSSVAGYIGLPTASAYGLTKAGLINMCETMHVELRSYGIDLRLVSPGFVRTPLTDKNDFPMPFLLEPEDAAQRIYRGLQKNTFEISFPWQLVWALRLLRALPYGLSLRLTSLFQPKS
ncbi:MAG: SDR family NAD(P)-dependent oxidoreductase [Alphaproteobacteria bacterium]|nr:SDR family NAD(P)-dependent oxidoreductase [Alphaproteobacteria bacterium]